MLLTQSEVRSGATRIADFPLHFGGELHDVRVAWALQGAVGGPVVVVLGGISAGRNVSASTGQQAGWWQDFVGQRRAVDTEQFDVLGIDFVGGSGASTGPRTEAFPAVSSYDQARAVYAVLEDLGIECIEAFVGSSYGGMVALAFASLFPQRVRQLIVISAAHEPHPMATALRSLQRRTIRLGLENGCAAEAISIARGIAMTTYRTSAEFAQRFETAPQRAAAGFHFPIEAYLAHCGETYARQYLPWGFLCLSESIDLHRVDPSTIRTPTTLVSVDSDTLVPPWQMRALAAALRHQARLISINSVFGHDAFLKEVDAVSTILRTTLARGESR